MIVRMKRHFSLIGNIAFPKLYLKTFLITKFIDASTQFLMHFMNSTYDIIHMLFQLRDIYHVMYMINTITRKMQRMLQDFPYNHSFL